MILDTTERSDTASDARQAIEESRGPKLHTDLLEDHAKVHEDLKIVQRMIRERWPIGRRKRHGLIARLCEIVEKRAVAVEVQCGDDKVLMPMDDPADRNAINAGKLLSALVAMNQKDEHHSDEMKRPVSGSTINIDNRKVVHVLRVRDDGRGPNRVESK